jgi:cyclin-dependent kinase 12/13
MDHDLTGLLDSQNNKFEPGQIKYYMICLLRALAYLHDHRILHRDIKGSNILLSNNGEVRLSDFGLARWECPRNPRYTNRMITLWYRPLELLYGVENYDQSADIWSAGCIFAELLSGAAPFPGKSELDQIEKIFKVCGVPDEKEWPGFEKLPWYSFLKPKMECSSKLKETFGIYGKEAYDLLRKFLALDPSKRISAKEALEHSYFKTEPLPWSPSEYEFSLYFLSNLLLVIRHTLIVILGMPNCEELKLERQVKEKRRKPYFLEQFEIIPLNLTPRILILAT